MTPGGSSQVAIQAQIEWEYADADVRADRHGVLAQRWHRAAITSAWLAAAIAGLGGALSLLGGGTTVIRTVLAFVAAGVSAFIGACNPGRLAEAHQTAANGYDALTTPLSELLHVLSSSVDYVPMEETDHSGRTYDAGYYKVLPLPADELASIWKRFSELRAHRAEIRKSAPRMTHPSAMTRRSDRSEDRD